MFAVLSTARKALRPAAFALSALALSACDASLLDGLGSSGPSIGPRIDPSKTVQVALLLPKSDANVAAIATSLENAARMAIAENPGAKIDLRVYDTAGRDTVAAAQAQRAVDEGAKIILGPLFQAAVNAAGVAVSDEGINVLGFSNNPTIAGGNVFILSPTFGNTANRLMGFAKKRGKKSVVVLHESGSLAGELAKSAVEQAALANGVLVSAESYVPSVAGVTTAARKAGQIVQSGAADSVFITSDAQGGVAPIILQIAPEAGATRDKAQYIGLTRWDKAPQLYTQPGAEGAWFAVPDPTRQVAFEARYRASFSKDPHILAGTAFDSVAAVAGMIASGRADALTTKALTRSNGFNGAGGTFRLLPDGTNERALAVAQVRNKQVVIIEPAPSSLGGAGS